MTIRPKKLTLAQRCPHVIVLPKGAQATKDGNIYNRFDIVSQGRVLWSQGNTIRSAEPFVLKFQVNGKVKTVESKVK